jgi:hypothetical protein
LACTTNPLRADRREKGNCFRAPRSDARGPFSRREKEKNREEETATHRRFLAPRVGGRNRPLSLERVSTFDMGDAQCVGPIPPLSAEFLRGLMIGMTAPFTDRFETLPVRNRDPYAVRPAGGLDAEKARLGRGQKDHFVGRLRIPDWVLRGPLRGEDHGPVGRLAGKDHGSRAEPSVTVVRGERSGSSSSGEDPRGALRPGRPLIGRSCVPAELASIPLPNTLRPPDDEEQAEARTKPLGGSTFGAERPDGEAS